MLSELAAGLDGRGRAVVGGITYHVDDDRSVAGVLAPLLGPRVPRERLEESSDGLLDADEERALALVRAYPLSPMLGARFTCTRDAELADRLEVLLVERCPVVDWRVQGEGLAGLFRKHAMVHTSVDAPVDESTGQPMALELYGVVVELDGRPAVGNAVLDVWRSGQSPLDPPAEVVEPFTVELRAATYANVAYPGAGVPLFM